MKTVPIGTFYFVLIYDLFLFVSINGVPACASKKYLTDILRTQWGFKGYVSSDLTALEFMYTRHNYTTGPLDSAVAAVRAGCNLELSGAEDTAYSHLTEAVQLGLLTMEELLVLVRPLFYTRMRLGEFDPPKLNPYTSLRAQDVVESQEHQNLAVTAALKSFVLLKHTNNILPVGKIQKLAVSNF